jgi:hypothetical protein
MEHDEKISKIEDMLRENIPTIEKIVRRPERESMTLCLVIWDKVIGVDIQKSFIDSRTIEEIEDHFSKRSIYHSILSDYDPSMCDHDGVFTYINDPSCRDMPS